MRSIFSLLLAGLLIWLAWVSWQPPASQNLPQNRPHISVPEDESEPWHVITRKIISKPSAESMQKRLAQAGLKPVRITRREVVELYAFDGARTFPARKEAVQALAEWKKLKLDANIMKTNDAYSISLGRFYMAEYTLRMHARLKKSGKPYRYEKRKVSIPVYRFSISSDNATDARALWQKVQELGIAEPVLMPEKQFMDIYGETGPEKQPG